MQNCTTILGIIDMRQRGISYDDCRSRYKVGCSTITLIMNRFKESGKDLDTLKQMSAEEVEHLFFPPENLRRKDDSVMPDYQAVYERLTMPGSKANLFYLWLKYKKDCPSGYQYTQYCLYFKRFVEKHYGSEAVSMVVERIPGEKVYIDWVGDQPEILVDSSTGEIKKVHFFVTTVGAVSYTHLDVYKRQRCDRIKALLWESDGFVLLYKRMEVQGRFRWPRNQLEVKQLTWQQFDWLMSGLEIEQPKAFKPTQ